MKKFDKALEFANVLNEKYADNFNIPILGGFKVVNNPGTMFTAVSKEGYVEQFIVDGILLDGETFESRLDSVVNNTRQSMADHSFENPQNSLKYLKNYKANGIEFSVYVQDNIISVKNIKRIIRQFNIYFLDKNSKSFNMLSIATPPIELPSSIIIVDEIDLKNDEMTKSLNTAATDLMNHITYK